MATVYTLNMSGMVTSGGARMKNADARREALSAFFHGMACSQSGNGIVYVKVSRRVTKHLALVPDQTNRPWLWGQSCRSPL